MDWARSGRRLHRAADFRPAESEHTLCERQRRSVQEHRWRRKVEHCGRGPAGPHFGWTPVFSDRHARNRSADAEHSLRNCRADVWIRRRRVQEHGWGGKLDRGEFGIDWNRHYEYINDRTAESEYPVHDGPTHGPGFAYVVQEHGWG